ncbi:aspartate kinase [Rasiella rasia]|uniref:Aspartokinase n=1 Tax=Rasiella rasia TaxID=2744027 RepID=A0A6G6GMH9_9FLAO|nr:aspartate kinase [Rasiella rasia]QIE59759.1 aspartate kinase [Rasiella rasia]
MKVFKFGGASVKDAEGVKNLARVLQITEVKDVVVVVSAMGKMTNALEQVVHDYFNDLSAFKESKQHFISFHHSILNNLFATTSHPVYEAVNNLAIELSKFLDNNKSKDHAFVYDQVVSYGELTSTTILSHYLSEIGVNNTLLDVRNFIVTNDTYREAMVDWDVTQQRIVSKVSEKGITITQGFLGAEGKHNFTTTLGREGSDYTAAIFAYCLNAESVTIWKDVPGVLNADPRHFAQTTLLNQISYREAIELAFYGASVIHPKTLQPLQRKEIPLYVKSFMNPLDQGTCVGKGVTLDPMVSCFILKKNQVLISLSSLDFNFMMEHHIGDVFKWLHTYKMKVELIQNSAISFSVCVDNKYNTLEPLLAKLRSAFKVSWNENVTLYTIRHASPKQVKAILKDKTLLVKQESRGTVQLVVKE